MQNDLAAPGRKLWEKADLVLYITDVTDFPGTFSRRLAVQCGQRTVLVLNKADLLPARLGTERICQWAKSYLAGVGAALRDVKVVSAIDAADVKKLWAEVGTTVDQSGMVAVVGAHGVGKTTLCQALTEAAQQMPAKKKRSRRRGRSRSRPPGGEDRTVAPVD